MQKRMWLICAGALVGTCLGSTAWAQSEYPNRPITLIVPYGAGGVTDVMARSLAQAMSTHLNQSIVIENKPGAGASMGVMDMKTAKPDGYRLTLTPAGIFRQPYIQKVKYDPLRDVSFIASFMEYDFILAVPSESPFKTVKDLVEYNKKDPGAINYGSAGRYSGNHVTMALLEQQAGTKFTHIPYKGDAEAANALLAQHSKSAVFGNTVLPYLTSGKLRALAIASPERTQAFANVPTFKEQGYDIVVPSPLGLGGPHGLAPEVIQKLQQAVQAALQDSNFKQTATNYGIRPEYRDANSYAALAQQMFAREKTIIATIGLE